LRVKKEENIMKSKNVILKKATLLIALLICIGVTDNKRALGITLPTSIHDILTTEQIDGLKNSQALRKIKNGIRGGYYDRCDQHSQVILPMGGKVANNGKGTRMLSFQDVRRAQPAVQVQY
jgi:hypothetical protein